MKINQVRFEIGVSALDQCPAPGPPEVALIGRSNVGKSSLINMLAGRKQGLAAVSSTPGKTRTINFYDVDRNWRLVDLPGYGYAKISKKDRAMFQDFVSDYLLNRESLRAVFVLIDSRLPPQDIDLRFIEWLTEVEIPFSLIFTKADKMKSGALNTKMAAYREHLAQEFDGDIHIYVTSAKTSKGRNELVGYISRIVTTS